jgi:hypothetical protein
MAGRITYFSGRKYFPTLQTRLGLTVMYYFQKILPIIGLLYAIQETCHLE